jgi:hypothetical protein
MPDLAALTAAARALPHALAHAASPLGAGDAACVAGAVIAQRVAARLGLWIYAIVALPGTLAHELAHAGMALLLRARPSLPSVMPRRSADGWRLGEVGFRAGMLRSVPIALAPVALAPLAFWLAAHTLAAHPVDGHYALWAWLCGTLASACLPSRPDWRIAAPGLAVMAAATAIAAGAWWAWHASH